MMRTLIVKGLMIDSIVSSFLLGNIRLALPEKWWILTFNIHKNNKRPIVDPSRTPNLTVLMLDEIPCKKSNCLRFLREKLT